MEKIPSVGNTIFTGNLSAEIRKDLSKLTLKGLRCRLAPLLQLIRLIAEKEDDSAKAIAAHELQLISNESKDLSRQTSARKSLQRGHLQITQKLCP